MSAFLKVESWVVRPFAVLNKLPTAAILRPGRTSSTRHYRGPGQRHLAVQRMARYSAMMRARPESHSICCGILMLDENDMRCYKYTVNFFYHLCTTTMAATPSWALEASKGRRKPSRALAIRLCDCDGRRCGHRGFFSRDVDFRAAVRRSSLCPLVKSMC